MKKNEKGLTIIETLLYMGLFAILLTVFTQVFVSMLETQLASESFSYISGDSKFIEQKITNLLRESDSIVSPTVGNSSGTLQVVANSITYTVSISDTNLVLNDGTGSYNINSENTTIDSFTATNSGDEILEVGIQVTSNVIKEGVQDESEINIVHNIR